MNVQNSIHSEVTYTVSYETFLGIYRQSIDQTLINQLTEVINLRCKEIWQRKSAYKVSMYQKFVP